MTEHLALGYIPLLDAAPLIVAQELGFAEEEGLRLDLVPATGWSMLRDLLDYGNVVAAQMLSVMPVARALGLGGGTQPLETALVLSLNGQVFSVSDTLAPAFEGLAFGDAPGAARVLADLPGPLRIGVPFPFSMQAELLHYWLSRAAPSAGIEIRTVPPPRMAEALLAKEIDGFCVGEPWGSHAVETADARLVLPGSAIWSQAPEKVLAMRQGWAESEPELAGRLLRAVWRAGSWAGKAENRDTLSEILARPDYLGVPSELIDRVLHGRMQLTRTGIEIAVDQFQTFHAGVASFPWRSQAAWIGARLAERFGLPDDAAQATAAAVFRSDLHRRFLGPLGVPLPRASGKVEGALDQRESVPGVRGMITLERNRFFDGQFFDPKLPG